MDKSASAGANARRVRESWLVSDMVRRPWHSAPGRHHLQAGMANANAANAAHSFAGLELSRRAQRSPSASLLQLSTRRLRKKLVLALKGRGFQPRPFKANWTSRVSPQLGTPSLASSCGQYFSNTSVILR